MKKILSFFQDLNNVEDIEDVEIPWNQNSAELKSEEDKLVGDEENFEISLNIDYTENDSDYIPEEENDVDFTGKNPKIGIETSNNYAENKITEHFPEKRSAKKGKRFFSCECCDWKGENIRKHWTENHSNKDYPFLCEKCDYRGLTHIHLDSHKREKHNSK